MLTELLRPRGDSNVGQTQKIEVLNNEDDADGDDGIDDNDEQWYYKQELPEDKPDDLGAARIQDAGRTPVSILNSSFQKCHNCHAVASACLADSNNSPTSFILCAL